MSAAAEAITPTQHARILSDRLGPYGLEVGDVTLNARPDKVDDDTSPGLFHTLPRGVPRWCRDSREYRAYEAMRDHLLAESGLARNRAERFRLAMTGTEQADNVERWCRQNGGSRADYLRHYHAACKRAAAIINGLLNTLFAEAVPGQYLRAIRRWPSGNRGLVYSRLCAGGPRAWQLAETFPLLAIAIYCGEDSELEAAAAQAVKAGVKLPSVAAMMGISPALRHFPPGTMGRLWGLPAKVLNRNPDIVRGHAPATVPKMNAWLRAIRIAHEAGEDFAVWTARHGMDLGHWRDVAELVRDIRDWVDACHEAEFAARFDTEHTRGLESLLNLPRGLLRQRLIAARERGLVIPRPFNPEMAPQTVRALSDEWHEAVSRLEGVADVEFPEPWYDGATVGGFEITPIRSAEELLAAARVFHNCASGYAASVARGECFLYKVGADVAMVELVRGKTPALGQLKGPCNRPVHKDVTKAVRAWLRAARKGACRMPAEPVISPVLADDDIPF